VGKSYRAILIDRATDWLGAISPKPHVTAYVERSLGFGRADPEIAIGIDNHPIF
jgi:hypothetical protein